MRKNKQVDTRKNRTYHQTEKRKAKVKEYNKSPEGRYQAHKLNAKTRDVTFLLTFNEWWEIWKPKWHLRGRGVGKYHMCRYGDIGGYTLNNVYLATHTQNVRDKTKAVGVKGREYPVEAIQRIKNLRQKGLTCREISNMVGCGMGTIIKYTKHEGIK
jgi:hypothetical protein